MPKKRLNRSPDKRTEEEDDDFLFDDSQSSSGRSGHEPIHRNAANARERARMRVLSKAFCRLKTTLPWVPADTKLSKLDTLRLAASYIAHLRALLHEPRSAHTPPHPLSLIHPTVARLGSATGINPTPKSRGELSSTAGGGKPPISNHNKAWPFAFQHGGTLGCGVSQRWSLNAQPETPNRNPQNQRELVQTSIEESYGQDYSENDYEERNYDDMATNEQFPQMQYNYGYKENYYEMRNSYLSDGLVNNV